MSQLRTSGSNRNDLRFGAYVSLFAVSGAAGLIYESIWSHYLKLFLGHASYSQTLVLVIFMGGMAIGAALAGRYGYRVRNMLRAYAVVEALIGLAAIGFHPLYTAALEISYTTVFPAIDSAAGVAGFKWSLGAMLILPQSILLGATFPFMSAGIVRRFPQRPGRSLAVLYFANSLGASLGVLASGFILVPSIGLPGTVQLAGAINLALAAVVWQLASSDAREASNHVTIAAIKRPALRSSYGGFLLVAAVTGAASFLYEISWIRMLSLVLGSTTHAFELMLSAFILGLAIGGFAIRQRIDRLRSPVRTLGWIQLCMGVLAVGTLIIYGSAFEVMGYVVRHLDKTQAGYVYFNLISHGIALIVMLPATICAGMTLPLITYQLLRLRYGEGAIGAVYAGNTVGAIVGVVLAVQLMMPAFGLKSVVMLGGFLDVLLGIVLLANTSKQHKWWDWRLPAASTLGLLGVVALTIRLDPVAMTSGVYVTGEIRRERQILFQRDGKTASISLFRNGDYLALTTNGKTEAAISSSELSKDEPTMILLGLLPLSLHPQAKQVATIGIGSGLTSHSLLNATWLEGVDTIEIEPAMVEAARGFNERVENVFTDPRSQIHIEDAKAFFTNHGKLYDLIVSEPSNPWVSGVAGLFSDEFYGLIGNHLSKNGLLVQWLHLYHLDLPLVASVVKALSPHFSDYAIYALNLSDIVIVATKRGQVATPDSQIFQHTAVANDLARVGVNSIADINLRRIGTRESVDAFFSSFEVPANSDYYPYLDFVAARSRYLQKDATELLDLALLPASFREIMGMRAQTFSETPLGENYHLPIVREAKLAEAARTFIRFKNDSDATPPFAPVTTTCASADQALAWIREVHELADATLPFFGPGEMAPIWEQIQASGCLAQLSGTSRSWVALYKALDARAIDEFVRISEHLLPPEHIEKSRGNDYLLASALVGRHALGDRDSVAALWARYGRSDEPGVLLRYVRSRLQDRNGAQQVF